MNRHRKSWPAHLSAFQRLRSCYRHTDGFQGLSLMPSPHADRNEATAECGLQGWRPGFIHRSYGRKPLGKWYHFIRCVEVLLFFLHGGVGGSRWLPSVSATIISSRAGAAATGGHRVQPFPDGDRLSSSQMLPCRTCAACRRSDGFAPSVTLSLTSAHAIPGDAALTSA